MKLIEITSTSDETNIENTAEFLIQNCKPFIQAMNYNVADNRLCRGLKVEYIQRVNYPDAELFVIPGHIKGRQPVDTPPIIHNSLNKLFVKKFGVPFRDGIFTSPLVSVAWNYGNMAGWVLPIGNFKFLWSPVIRDLYATYINMVKDAGVYSHTSDADKIEKMKIFNDTFAQKIIDIGNYKSTDLPAAIPSHNEIMIYCNKCYVLRADGENQNTNLAILKNIQRKGAWRR